VAIQHTAIPAHWNYFLALEDDVRRLSRWIEFDKSNEAVFSIELARLLMTAAAEADVVAKALCARIRPKAKADSINKYQALLTETAPLLVQAHVSMPLYGMSFRPWSNWKKKDTPPDWWSGNNKVKHHRAEHFKEANLKNVLNATAGLLMLLLLYYGADGPYIIPAPRIYVPTVFGVVEGDSVRILIPDSTKFPALVSELNQPAVSEYVVRERNQGALGSGERTSQVLARPW
jgi:hypothetical protein